LAKDQLRGNNQHFGPYARRQLFANAVMAASHVAVRRRAVLVGCPKGKVHIQGEPTGAALALKMRPCAIRDHVEIVIVPLAGWARGGRAFED
jgi:hypothetical protein